MNHARISNFSGRGGPCGDGYHFAQIGLCSCGWRVEVAWIHNSCGCDFEHTADDLLSADKVATRLVNKHVKAAQRQADGQEALL